MKTKFTLLALLAFFVSATGFAQTSAITGSLSTLSGYTAGETVEIPFVLDLTNTDQEWVDSLSITFPSGFTIESVSNDDVFFPFDSPDFEDEMFNGIDGQTVSWGDNDNFWGGIAAPNAFPFTITVTVDGGITGEQTIDFFASGDQFADPADLSGTATISEGASVYGIVVNSPDHTILELAINSAGLANSLAGDIDPVTLFAPTDDALNTFLTDNGLTAAELLGDPNLENILLYHALGISAPSSGLTDGQVVETLLTGETVTIGVVEDPFAVTVNGENVSTPDLDGSNGIVHVIDGVLTPPPPIEVPVDFELDPEFYDIEGFGGAENTSIIPNPDATGVNTSATVWQQTQNSAATPLFAGAVLTVDVPVDFSTNPIINMDVWTPMAGDEVTLKLEDGNGAEFELVETSQEAGAWETLTFDFTGEFDPAVDYTRLVVFFNNGSENVDETYYADNIVYFPTIFDIVEGSEDHTTLEDVLVASGLDAVLGDAAFDLTLFAPTDEAFENLPAGVLTELEDDPTGALANVLLYHVVGGTNLSGDLENGEVLTLQGETVTVNTDGPAITINGAEVSIADIPAANGVVHVIDAVLVPTLCTVTAAGPFGDFTNAFGGVPVEANGLCPFNSVVNAFEDPFQLLASESYAADGATEGVTYEFGTSGGNIGAWDPVHIIRDAATGAVIASETGNSITWTAPADGDYTWIIQEDGTCGFESMNLATDNGFPYMTCLGSSTITGAVVELEDFSTLETAVVAAGLQGTLDGEGPFTVFAPTDAAFDALPEGLLQTLLDDPNGLLTDVLTHHVIGSKQYSTDLSDGQVVETLNMEEVTISIDDVSGEITITSALGDAALVIDPDNVASNGVIHIIDAVLTPTILSVENLNTVDKLSVFPNPTNNQFTLDIELNASERVSVDLVNVVGQVVKSIDLGNRSAGLNREYIDVNDLSEGIYFMNLNVGDNQATLKVQVVR